MSEQPPEFSDREKALALELLREPQLLTQRFPTDLHRLGLVGETWNGVIFYLAALTRGFPTPVSILLRGGAESGKTKFLRILLRLMPPEDIVQFATLRELRRNRRRDLQNKIVVVTENLSAAQLTTVRRQGPVWTPAGEGEPIPILLVLSTAEGGEAGEALAHQFLTLVLDESSAHQRAVQRQRQEEETFEGRRQKRKRERIWRSYQISQRLLRSIEIVNPLASAIRFSDPQTRAGKTHTHYLALLRAAAYLLQCQYPLKKDSDGTLYGEVNPECVQIVNHALYEVLRRSLDPLSSRARALLRALLKLALERGAAEKLALLLVDFTRFDITVATGLRGRSLHNYVRELQKAEYLFLHEERRKKRFVYSLTDAGLWEARRPLLVEPAETAFLLTPPSPALEGPPPETSPPGENDTKATGPAEEPPEKDQTEEES